MSQLLTKPGTRKLSDVARHVTVPSGIVTTGYPAVRDKCRDLGIVHDDWQQGLCRLMLGKRADGKYAATVGGITLSIMRQVGKTFTVGSILFALCMLFPGMTVLWTAHRTRTSNETFKAMQAMARRQRIAPFISRIRTTNGEQEIGFRNGSRILFGARERGFGLGFTEVDIVVFDEAQILTEKALEDMVAPTNQSRHPAGALLFYMGTPPRPTDPGEVFTGKRDRALSGTADDMVYVEISADPDCDPDDRAQWAKNPSFPERTPIESMMRLRENLGSDDAFLRQGLGVWDAVVSKGVIPMDAWDACGDELSLPADRFALGLEAGPDLASASVALAGQRTDGRWHVELYESKKNAHWLAPYVDRLVRNNPEIRAVVGDVGGPLVALLEQKHSRWYLKGTRIVVTPLAVRELGAACSVMFDGIVTGDIVHAGQHQLTAAAQAATRRSLGDTGMWVFHRASSVSDITPIQAATLALRGAQHTNVKRPGRSRDSERRAVVL